MRTPKRTSTRGSYGEQALSDALQALTAGTSLKKASKDYGIPRKTLRRHRDKKVSNPGKVFLGGKQPTLSPVFELELVKHIQRMEKALFGLTTLDMRKLAFEFAERAKIKHNFNKELRMAGIDWLRGFRSRHPILSLRSPQGTSIGRAVGFNRPKVLQFFTAYKEVLQNHSFSANDIWNMDESGITNVAKPCKVLATKGKRQVSKITSAERGSTVTVVCANSASGQYIPPMMIFPRMRMVPALMNGAPAGAIGACSPNGWTDSSLFLQWLRHFVQVTRCSKTARQVLIMDGHASHKSLEAIIYARDNGITMITLPPHSTHKMQPLDRTFFKSLKVNYNRAADSWMTSNPGQRITFFQMAGLFQVAYNSAATVEKAVTGFRVSGIWPFNDEIFSDEDFEAAEVTAEPDPASTPISLPNVMVERDPASTPISLPNVVEERDPASTPISLPNVQISAAASSAVSDQEVSTFYS
jgi:hypothetical protein